MISPLTLNRLNVGMDEKISTGSNRLNITTKVSDAWHTKSTTVKPTASQERYIVLTDAEHTEINQLLSQLKIDDTNNEARRANFLVLYKKLANSTNEAKERFITGAMQRLKTPDAFADQEQLKATFEKTLYRVNAANLMTQPFINQMNDSISSISLEGDQDDEFKFY